MTNPDMSSPYDVSATFKWDNKYDEQLRFIAETDEIPDREETWDWDALRDAIKYKIKLAIGEFADVPSPALHPAARAQATSAGPSSAAASSSAPVVSGLGITTAAEIAAHGLENRFASSSSSAAAADGNGSVNGNATAPANGSSPSSSPPDEEGRDEDVNMSFDDNGNQRTASLSGDGTTAGAAETLAADTSDASISASTSANHFVFLAAKSKAPSDRKGNWGRILSPEEKQAEMCLIFSMLDDFEGSPPFTIQRLAELVLTPHAYVRSAPKFLMSLMRLLSVTATHADFPPVSPGPPPLFSNGQVAGAATAAGGVSMRSVGPPSPSSEPLFSPIPFLQRPQRNGDGEQHEQEAEEDGVPTLDLNATAARPAAATTVDGQSNVPAAAPSPSGALPSISSSSSAGGSVGSNATSQPLGVPHGQVDELEEVDHDGADAGGASNGNEATLTAGPPSAHHMDGRVHPLTSTTTTTTAAAAAAKHKDDDEDKDDVDQREDDDRGSKRLRSKSPFRAAKDDGADEQDSSAATAAQTGIDRAGKEARELDARADDEATS